MTKVRARLAWLSTPPLLRIDRCRRMPSHALGGDRGGGDRGGARRGGSRGGQSWTAAERRQRPRGSIGSIVDRHDLQGSIVDRHDPQGSWESWAWESRAGSDTWGSWTAGVLRGLEGSWRGLWGLGQAPTQDCRRGTGTFRADRLATDLTTRSGDGPRQAPEAAFRAAFGACPRSSRSSILPRDPPLTSRRAPGEHDRRALPQDPPGSRPQSCDRPAARSSRRCAPTAPSVRRHAPARGRPRGRAPLCARGAPVRRRRSSGRQSWTGTDRGQSRTGRSCGAIVDRHGRWILDRHGPHAGTDREAVSRRSLTDPNRPADCPDQAG